MKKVLLSTTILLTTFSLLNATTDKEIKKEAKSAIMKMGKALKSNMKKSMKSGGALQAAKFCLEKASEISKNINSSYPKGISVKRISLKYRNPKNRPSEDEAKVLEQIQNDVNAKKTIPKMIVKKIGKNSYKVYKPIFMDKAVCMSCHGDAKTRNAEAYKLIKEKYPQDKAIGYKRGDFRGAFVATIIK